MTELARITCYNGLIEAFRARKAALRLSDEVLDELAGLTRGHTSKVLGASRGRGIGAVVLEGYLTALAIDLVMVENPDKLAELEYAQRNERTIHKRAYRLSKQAMAHARNLIYAEFGSRGGKARARNLTAEQRSEIARAAALAMHRKRREMVAA